MGSDAENECRVRPVLWSAECRGFRLGSSARSGGEQDKGQYNRDEQPQEA